MRWLVTFGIALGALALAPAAHADDLVCPDGGAIGYGDCADAAATPTASCVCTATACNGSGGYTTTRTCQPAVMCPDTTACAGKPQGAPCTGGGICKIATMQCLSGNLFLANTFAICDHSGDAAIISLSGPPAADASPGTNNPSLASYSSCTASGDTSLPLFGAPVALALLFALGRRWLGRGVGAEPRP